MRSKSMTGMEASPTPREVGRTLEPMSDLLVHDAVTATTSAAPTASPTPPPAFPPPDPAADAASRRRTTGLLTLLGLTGLAIGVIMTILWLGSKGETDSVVEERDLAIAERDAATDSLTATQTELDGTTDTLGSMDRELQTALAALETAQNGEPESAPADVAEIARLEAQVAEIQAAATATAAENTRLNDELDTAAAAPVVPEAVDPVEFDAAATPGFARWVGELLSSSSGSSRLGADASTCFGTEIIELIGVDAIGVGQHNSSSGADRQVVIDAMISAAGTCGIDTGLIF